MKIIIDLHQITQTMFQYNNDCLPCVGRYQIWQSFPFKTMIIDGEWIHFTHFIDKNKKHNFIFDITIIRNISSIEGNLHRDGCTHTKRYEEIMVNSFLGEVSEFINKWGIDMVPINIHISVNDVNKNK